MGYWLKLYTDILDDPKYFRLSKEAKLGMYELLLVAKKVENGELTGKLPCIEDIAFYTRRPIDEWQKLMPELVSIGLVTDQDNPVITNYIKRQEAIDPETRMKQYRKKRNDTVMTSETELQRDCNEIATNRNKNATNRNGEVEVETEVEVDKKREEVEVEDSENDDNDPSQDLLTTFSAHSKVDLGAEAEIIAAELSKKGVISSDVINAINFLNNKPGYKCTSFKSIRAPALIEMERRKGKKIPKDDQGKYLAGEYGDIGKHW